MSKWGSEVEIERRNRIRISIFAFAYEVKDNPLISDHDFDKLCLEIKPKIKTNYLLDDFFLNEFDPCTGSWIHNHPELAKIEELYYKYLDFKR